MTDVNGKEREKKPEQNRNPNIENRRKLELGESQWVGER
jgi:hypothetical protein